MPFHSLADYKKTALSHTAHGHRLAYWKAGEETGAQALVFLHGFPSATWDWHAQWAHLGERFTCYGFDFLGYGLSAKPFPHNYSLLEQADLVEAMVAHWGLNTVKIVAHDYGVSVAQELLTRQEEGSLPFNCEQIVFLNGGLFSDVHRPLATQKILSSPLGKIAYRFLSKRTFKKAFDRILSDKYPPSDTVIDTLWTLMSHDQGTRCVHYILQYLGERAENQTRWTQAMQSSNIPQAFINGIEDPISGGHMLEAFEARVPKGQGIRLDAGHYPQLEVPERVNKALSDLLS